MVTGRPQVMVPPVSPTDVRVYDAASGTYLHAADLARMLRHAATIVDPISALALPQVALLVERLALRTTEAKS